ncbi:hypothetical protein [Streptococcus gallolyticus]|uniref:hypothetical protein n=1 Tax=Streptococcus gallolyticus TaxID=315405 RepID=UPI002284E0C0|nr:hypothetical protein [Streptococcus gallolyticus]MCY7187279.1 hypothetical protein [Streptococcus gallolyticus subsp. gallolyticus]
MDDKNNTSLYDNAEEFPFPAVTIDKDEEFINISNKNYAMFKKEIATLEQKAIFENTKEFMTVIEDDIERFYKNFHKVKNGEFSEENYGCLSEINYDIKTIAETFEKLACSNADFTVKASKHHL